MKPSALKSSVAVLLLMGACGLGSTIAAEALTFGPLQPISGSGGDAPRVAAVGTRVYVAWQESSLGNSEIRFRGSADSGTTWAPPLGEPGVNLSGNATDSVFPGVAASGLIVVVMWTDNTNQSATYGGLLLRRSMDGGATFAPTEDLGAAPLPYIREHRLVVQGQNIYVVWQDSPSSFGPDEIRFRRLVNGTTWDPALSQPPRVLWTNTGVVAGLAMVAGGSNLYIVWPTTEGLRFTRSGDSGATFDAPRLIGNAILPDIAAEGAQLYVVGVHMAAVGSGHIVLRRSPDAGVSWIPSLDQEPQPISQTSGLSWEPRIRASSTDVYVVWLESSGSDPVAAPFDVVFRRSLEGGATWDPAPAQPGMSLGARIPGYAAPELELGGGSLYVAWEDVRGAARDILFRTSSDRGTNWSPQLGESATNVSANASDSDFLSMAAAGSRVYVAWRDISAAGPEVSLRRAPDAVTNGGRRVIVVNVDGLRRDTFDIAYLNGLLPNFSSVFGVDYANAFRFRNATTILPSVTLSGHASLFTGTYPGGHGIVGNQWFDRVSETMRDYMSLVSAACVYGTGGCEGGLANGDLTSETVYEAATRAGKASMVVFNQYWKGATHSIQPSFAEQLLYVSEEVSDSRTYDEIMMTHAIELLLEKGLADIVTVYFAGADAVGHRNGVSGQIGYLQDVIDVQLGRLITALSVIDPNWRASTLIVFVSDHGRTDTVSPIHDRRIDDLLLKSLKKSGFGEDLVRLALNGGIAHLYLRSRIVAMPWSESPPRIDVLFGASALFRDRALGRYVEAILVREEAPTKGYRIYEELFGGPVLRDVPADRRDLLEGLDSPRSGDIVVVLKQGHYFLELVRKGLPDLESVWGVGSSHGSWHATDLAVPLVFGGQVVVPGESNSAVRNTAVAATIAKYLGFPLPGAEAELPEIVFVGE